MPHHKRSLRLTGYDCASPGAYFLTICTNARVPFLGEPHGSEIRLSGSGRIAAEAWGRVPAQSPGVEVDGAVVMPNHTHAIIIIHVGAKHRATRGASPLPRMVRRARGTGSGSIPAIVRNLKSTTARRINASRGTPGAPVWRRGYHEHIVRNPAELDRLRQYVEDNTARWAEDNENPARPLRQKT